MAIARTWATSHKLVAELDKDVVPAEFVEMANFLRATSLKYALTTNPTIYATHIQQFWQSAKATEVNGETCVEAIVDKCKVTIFESTIRDTLVLEDADGVTSLSRDVLFKGLEDIG